MKIVVGLSGGVDSATTAAQYVQDGHDVVGCTLVMQHEPIPVPPVEALERAREVCETLGIPHIVRDCSERFSACVSTPFCDLYLSGATPSPCMVCNRHVKLPELFSVAEEVGADLVATGHYARKVLCDDGVWRIAAAADPDRDQSYFLSQVPAELVARLDLPLAEWTKAMTRSAASDAGLSVAFAKDSQGVCFAPGGDYRALLEIERPGALVEGPILDEAGTILGTHPGCAFFTPGQRKGIGLSDGPWYVVEIRPEDNAVVVGREQRARASEFRIGDLVLTCDPDTLGRKQLMAQTGHRMPKKACSVAFEADGSATIHIDGNETLYAVAGQACALYEGDIVMAGGTIL
jgi:tRNA-specific 2-thiouridylase